MLKNSLFATTVLAAGTLGVAGAFAAADGTTGATSTGNLIVSMQILNQVKISNLADVNLGTYTGSNLTGSEAVCAYFNQGAVPAPIQLTVDSNDTPGTFELEDGGSNTIPYSITYDDGSGAAAVAAGVAATGVSVQANNTDDDCVTIGSDTGTFAFLATAANITGNPNGTYSEQINITVAPDI